MILLCPAVLSDGGEYVLSWCRVAELGMSLTKVQDGEIVAIGSDMMSRATVRTGEQREVVFKKREEKKKR